MTKTKTIMTSIIAMTFIIGITANYAYAGGAGNQVEGSVSDADGEFFAWDISGATGQTILQIRATCVSADNFFDPILTVQSPSGEILGNDDWDSMNEFICGFGSQIVFGEEQEVENGCYVTQVQGFSASTGDFVLSLNMGPEGDEITLLGTVDSLADCPINDVPEIEKTLLDGPEEIGISLPTATTYLYTIEYTGPPALVKDTVPAEFEVLSLAATDGAAIDFKPGKGPKSQGATKIEWLVPAGTSTLTVEIETVQSPGKGHKLTVFKPTSCGPLSINDGATAFELDENGELVLVELINPDTGEVTLEPVVIVGPSNSLEVEAVDGAKLCIEIDDRDPN